MSIKMMKNVFYTLLISTACLSSLTINAQTTSQNNWRKRAITKLEPMCKAGQIDKCYDIGVIYLTDEQLPHDGKKIAHYLGIACDGRVADACLFLGSLYGLEQPFTEGVEKDEAKGLTFYKRGCDYGSMVSCATIASIYAKSPLQPDKAEMAKIYAKKACDGGDQEGCNILHKLPH